MRWRSPAGSAAVNFQLKGWAAGGYLFLSYVVAGTLKRWAFRHPVNMRLGNPGGIRLTVDGKNPLPPGTANPITLRLGLPGKITS
jgi:hypothetical protein